MSPLGAFGDFPVYMIQHAADYAGLVLPPFIDYINKDVKSETQRFWITVLTCLVVSVLLKWDMLLLGSPDAIFSSALVIFAESQIVFKTYFKNSSLRQVLQTQVLAKPDATPAAADVAVQTTPVIDPNLLP